MEKAFSEYVLLDKNEQEIDISGKVEYYLPRILSIIPFGRDIKELRSGLPAPMDAKRKPKQPKRTREEREDIDFHENVDMIRQLVRM